MFLFYTLSTFANSPLLSINTDFESIIPVVKRILKKYTYDVLDLSEDDVIYIQLYPEQESEYFMTIIIDILNSLESKVIEISGFNHNGEITPYLLELPIVSFSL